MAKRFIFALSLIANCIAAAKPVTSLAGNENLDIYVNRNTDEFNRFVENEDRLVLLIMNNISINENWQALD